MFQALVPLEREDTLTCLLSGVSKIADVSFKDIKETDVRQIFEIYDTIGGKGLTSGLVGGETGFRLLLIEGVITAACVEGAVSLEESKQETTEVNENKSSVEFADKSSFPEYLLELLDRYGVVQYCQKITKHPLIGNFELVRTAVRMLNFFENRGISSTPISGDNRSISILLGNLTNKKVLGDKLQCSVQGMDDQITRAMDLGYQFASLLAQPSGVSKCQHCDLFSHYNTHHVL